MENYDVSTSGHTARMALYSVHLAREVGIQRPRALEEILMAAILHDIGKISVRRELLQKPGPLSPTERRHMETHALEGAKLIASLPGWGRISQAICAHHEKWDGTGYPHRLAGESIPLSARIIAITDAFDALTSDRPYRRASSVAEARSLVQRGVGSHFDPSLTDVFLGISIERWEQLRDRANDFSPTLFLQQFTHRHSAGSISLCVQADSPDACFR
jgi:putative nucleotidyltransferase with HDIG domain